MHRRLRAPLRRQPSNCPIDILTKPQQVTDHVPVQQRSIGIRIGQVGRLQFLVPKLLEDCLGGSELPVIQVAKVQYGQQFGGANRHVGLTGLLAGGVPPPAQQTQGGIAPDGKGIVQPLVAEVHVRPVP